MLLDTSGLLCFFHRDETQHAEAMGCFREAPRRIVHNYVLAEFVALCTVRGVDRRGAIDFAAALAANPHVTLRWVDPELHEAALQLLADRPDKRYSLCDAVSFVVMREAGLDSALTTDHHFEQEGFKRLLAP